MTARIGPWQSRATRELAALDRRGFLRLAGLAAGAGLLPAGCGAVPAQFAPPTGLDLEHLTPRTYAVLNAAAARVAGPLGGALVRRRALDPARVTEGVLAGAPELAAPLRQALVVLEFGVQPLLAKWRPYTALGGAEQDAVLADLRSSRLGIKRQVFAGIRSICLLGVYTAIGEERPPGHLVGVIPADAEIADAMRPLG